MTERHVKTKRKKMQGNARLHMVFETTPALIRFSDPKCLKTELREKKQSKSSIAPR